MIFCVPTKIGLRLSGTEMYTWREPSPASDRAEHCSLLDATAAPCFHRNGANRPSCLTSLSLHVGQLYVQIEIKPRSVGAMRIDTGRSLIKKEVVL